MSTLVFDVHASIHFQGVRTALIRIPEVIQKIREVQRILDEKGISLDLSNFIASDDATFLHHYRRKEFAGIVLQLGLYDRYLRFFEKPRGFIGVVNSISALRIISGELSLEKFVEEAFRKTKSQSEIQELPGLPVLSGIQIPKYQMLQFNGTNKLAAVSEAQADLDEILSSFSKAEPFEVGVAAGSRRGTIELDPHLSWVWDQVKDSQEISQAN